MKTKKIILALAIVFALALGCDNGGGDSTEKPSVPQPATITQANGLGFDGTVKISTSDKYLNADWDEVVASVLTAFNAAYTAASAPSKGRFVSVFNKDVGAEIVLVNNLANNWEVRDGEFRTLYLKTGSITTAGYSAAVQQMSGNSAQVGKASPAKGGVFLARATAPEAPGTGAQRYLIPNFAGVPCLSGYAGYGSGNVDYGL
ncbi:MAG: hypothetical protein LBB89_13460 [Treponema sp.]|jgi:hypothetical protein|nr:hypothetical protein [Treponema sp.]